MPPEALRALRTDPWPGNIRQLENRLRKALVLAESTLLTPDDLDLRPRTADDTPGSLAAAPYTLGAPQS